ncbi:MAG: hypothetical protein AB8B65_02645 [Kordia sp.]|uniref:hypothetical protein n=1 Tax=Kordia sp. TaxID=1965332 RepID=UPI003859C2F2
MIKYEIYKNKPLNDEFISFGVLVKRPYDYLSMIFEGQETSDYVQTLIEGIQSVIDGDPDASYSIENQQGFIGYAFSADPTEEEYPEGGFQVFDFFTLDEQGDTKLMFVITLEEILKLLQDYKTFLVENKR